MNNKVFWEENISHGEILKKIWKHLDLGVLERTHPFHIPVFGTVALDGAPNLRCVVLRKFSRRNPRGLAFHTHFGAPKILEMQKNPQVFWLFYHPEEKFQLRIKGTATIHTDDETADEQWLATEFFSRRCYIGEAPSKLCDKPSTGLPEELLDRNPNSEESEVGRRNFAVIFSTIDSIDCMILNVRGNRRASFIWNDAGELEQKWMTP